MRFSATTVYSRERLSDFNKFVALEKRWYWLFLSLCTLVTIVSFFVSLFSGGLSKTAFFSMLLILAIDAFYAFVTFVAPSIAIKKSPTLDAEVRFEFDGDCFKVKATTKSGQRAAEHRYPTVIKARETKSVIYLFIAKQQAYIIDKATLEPSSIENFKTFLKNRSVNFK